MHCLDMHILYLEDMWETHIGQSSHLASLKKWGKKGEKDFIKRTINRQLLPLKTKRGVIILPDAVTVKAHVARFVSHVNFLI